MVNKFSYLVGGRPIITKKSVIKIDKKQRKKENKTCHLQA